MMSEGNSKTILITAGPTRETIDAVRYIENRSSGRMGLELAMAARDAGWTVTLLLGPTPLSPPPGIQTLRFESSSELQSLLEEHACKSNVVIMAAAVSDYRPAQSFPGKLPRTGNKLVLELEPTPDLLKTLADRVSGVPGVERPYLVGFALEEPDKLDSRSVEKMNRKGVDAIVANPLGTMGASHISATLITRDGHRHSPPEKELSKEAFGRWLISQIEQLLSSANS